MNSDSRAPLHRYGNQICLWYHMFTMGRRHQPQWRRRGQGRGCKLQKWIGLQYGDNGPVPFQCWSLWLNWAQWSPKFSSLGILFHLSLEEKKTSWKVSYRHSRKKIISLRNRADLDGMTHETSRESGSSHATRDYSEAWSHVQTPSKVAGVQ